MNAKTKSTAPIVRKNYTAQFKEQALVRADRDRVPKATQYLGIAESILELYFWIILWISH